MFSIDFDLFCRHFLPNNEKNVLLTVILSTDSDVIISRGKTMMKQCKRISSMRSAHLCTRGDQDGLMRNLLLPFSRGRPTQNDVMCFFRRSPFPAGCSTPPAIRPFPFTTLVFRLCHHKPALMYRPSILSSDGLRIFVIFLVVILRFLLTICRRSSSILLALPLSHFIVQT